ncbi:MAG: prolipoprotein diacylglyceryl transferase [Clostridiales bacterium]|nr:prolipoprotein diacylglyceryl transferase [Clostridiales bacterium]
MYNKDIFGIFHLYGIMIAVGILCCFLLLFYYAKKAKLQSKFTDFVFYNAIISIAIGFFSAALFQATYNYIDNPENGFNLKGGVTFIGGLIGGVACFLIVYAIVRKRFESKLLDILSFAPCCITVAHGFGRIGCLFAGCCHGSLTDAWYGIYMDTNKFGYAKVVPTQLFEALFLFALCAIIFLLVMKWKFKHGLSVYLVSYGIFRFCIEYARDDSRGGFIPGISPSQFWSICMVVIGIGLIFLVEYLWKKRKREEIVSAVEEVAGETTEEILLPSEKENVEENVKEEIKNDSAEEEK